MNSRPRASYTAACIIAGSLLMAGLSFLVPVVSTVQNPFVAHLRTAIALFAALPFIGASIWFMASLSRFKSGVRKAYIMASIGMILLAAGITQLPILGLFDLWNSAWALSGVVIIIFIVGAMLTYFGMRRFAHILTIQSRWRSIWLISVCALAFALVTYFVSPSLVLYDNVKDINSYLAAIGFAGFFMTGTAVLAHKVSRVIGLSYRKAMKLFALGNGVLAFTAVHEYTQSYFMNNGTPYNDYGFYMWPFATAACIMVFAAKEFASASEVSGAVAHSDGLRDSEYVDSIVAIAELASMPKDIDGILVGLRAITARLSPGEVSLNEEDKQQLLYVYKELEDYLTSGHDPLRTFTTEQIRLRLNPAFVAVLERQQH